MGLFSKFGKNKQESVEDSGYYRAADDRNLAERARAKRAAHAGAEAAAARGRGRATGRDVPDPVLPEKKRARRRLVGAIALALAVAIGLPMILDSEPKPLANDIAIQIPAKDKPADDKPAEEATVASAAPAKPVAQNEALDQSEEIVEPAEPAPKVAAATAPRVEPKEPIAWTEPKEVKPEPKKPEAKPEHKPEPKVTEHKPEPKADTRLAEAEAKAEAKAKARAEAKALAEAEAKAKREAKAETKPEPKHESKPDDATRAMAILEGKPAAKPAEADGASRYVIQVAALAAKDKVDELQGKLQAAGIKSFTQKSPSGELTRVKVGPFGSREEAEKAKAKLQKIGLSGSLVPV
ncbi:SPOR domain-containing protein [Pseudoduganella armeniaca]|uniref:SPOR domain-containing protein n=1 Tax=Pseudoduganella armeniaca TaxID=2072590 RepID=A0A2R4CET6_9BURK|nr:SPOR domain-containing protein [Pseudoduganella armeniaca]AVR97978.1 SPOR domain-containing protein [Pseudoduganella armeniaca]